MDNENKPIQAHENMKLEEDDESPTTSPIAVETEKNMVDSDNILKKKAFHQCNSC